MTDSAQKALEDYVKAGKALDRLGAPRDGADPNYKLTLTERIDWLTGYMLLGYDTRLSQDRFSYAPVEEDIRIGPDVSE